MGAPLGAFDAEMNGQVALRRMSTSFWERGRVLFNLALAPPAALGYLARAQLSAELEGVSAITPGSALLLFALGALGANLCFTLAYLLEFLVRDTPFALRWGRWARPITLGVGTLIGMGAAFNAGNFIAMVQYPFSLSG